MARRSDHSKDQLCSLALDAAERIVVEGGLQALTARKIASLIGYSPGTLYNLFENLDDLTLRVNARTLDLLDGSLRFDFQSRDVDRDVHSLLRQYLGFLRDHPHRWAALFDFALPDGTVLPTWYQCKIDCVLDHLDIVLSPLFDEGRSQRSAQAARTLWAGLHGIYALERSGKLSMVGSDAIEPMATMLVHTFCDGLKYRMTRSSNGRK